MEIHNEKVNIHTAPRSFSIVQIASRVINPSFAKLLTYHSHLNQSAFDTGCR
jgi:hypothetical protein